jgi:hypothetical protein
MRDLPAIDAFTEEIRLYLGDGTKTVLADGDWPVRAVAFAGKNILLVRDHGHSMTLSLPVGQSWYMSTHHDWLRLRAEIQTAVDSYRKERPDGVSMADAIVALKLDAWVPSFPGTPVPGEAWLKKDDEPRLSVGIFQQGPAVSVVVWVGSDMRHKNISTSDALPTLPAWLAPQIDDQRRTEAAAAAEEARRRALPLPDISEVIARLEAGEKISTGGGRYYEIFFIEDGKLRREIFDEGFCEILDATQAQLQDSIRALPDRFRKEA